MPDRQAVLAFARQTGELQRAALGALEALGDGLNQVAIIKRIIEQTPSLPLKLRQDARSLELKLLDLRERFTGDPTRSRRNEPAAVGLIDRIETIIGGHWSTTSAPTGSHRKNYEVAASEFEEALKALRPLLEHDLPALHETLEAAGAPGRRAASCRTGSGRSEWRVASGEWRANTGRAVAAAILDYSPLATRHSATRHSQATRWLIWPVRAVSLAPWCS